MKIAYILTSLSNSGPIIVAYDLVKLMVANGHDVSVYYFDQKRDLAFPCYTQQINMKSKIDFNGFDVIHCHGFRPDVFVMVHKPLKCSARIFTTIHSYIFQDHKYAYGFVKSKITSWLVLLATFRSNKIILLSKHMLEYYSKFLPITKLTYAYNTRDCGNATLDSNELAMIKSFKKTNPLLMSVSTLSPRKGLHQVISALQYLPEYRYCIVGDGEEYQRLEKITNDLNLQDRVLFVGKRPAGYRFLREADVFVMPSYSEGFPLAMLEAASMGKAIVCSDIPVFQEIFDDNEAVRYKLDDTISLSNAIKKAFVDKKSYETNCLRKYINEYSPACFYKRHLDIYNNLVKQF